MGLLDVADYARPDEFTQAQVAFLAMALVAHLSGGFGLTGHGAQLAGLGNVMGERFLAIHGLAELHCEHGGRRVVMVGRGNEDRVNLLADLVKHHPVIGEHLQFGCVLLFPLQPLLYLGVVLLVRIHDGHQVVLALGHQPVEMIHAASAAADLDAIEFAAWARSSEQIGDRQETTRGHRAGGQRTLLEKRAAVQCKLHSCQQLQLQAQTPAPGTHCRRANQKLNRYLNRYRACLRAGIILPPGRLQARPASGCVIVYINE